MHSTENLKILGPYCFFFNFPRYFYRSNLIVDTVSMIRYLYRFYVSYAISNELCFILLLSCVVIFHKIYIKTLVYVKKFGARKISPPIILTKNFICKIMVSRKKYCLIVCILSCLSIIAKRLIFLR